MAKKLGIYKCEVCGNIVEVLHAGAGSLSCCGQKMQGFAEKTEDASVEKHVPFIEKADVGYRVKVGQNQAHPMERGHYIQWIELQADGKVYRQFLQPGDAPEVFFLVEGDNISAREYCNVHGLWKG